MTLLQSLRAASTLQDVALQLGYKPQTLSYILYKMPAASKYQTFKIAKRGGGLREINAPCDELKFLQERLSNLLQNCVEEINTKRKLRDQMAHGFKRNRSIMTNAVKHRKRRFVFNLDLEDFFGTINFGRVRGFFIKDVNFLLHPSVATFLAQIACFGKGLPQGSPCSPVVSNLIGHVLDIQLCRLASKHGCTYSRYADDISFSTNKPVFPAEIASEISGSQHVWEVGPELAMMVAKAGFKVNAQKTRMQYCGSRQEVTGLVVNKKVNIRAEYRRNVRAMANRLFGTGSFQIIKMVPDPNGVLVRTKVDGILAQLHGMLGHINDVDRHNEEQEAKRASTSRVNKAAAKEALRSKQRLYRRFLLFKDFYSAPKPMVVCEGKTDNIYLLHALKHLAAKYPLLAGISASNKVDLRIRILRTFESSAGRILHLAQGWAGLKAIIESYVEELKRFKAPGMDHPVVLLIDNDSAADEIFQAIKKATGRISSKTDPFVHVAGNLYVVLTPLKAGAKQSQIEDCFDTAILNLNLGGKTFSPDAKADPLHHFGKHILSQYVRDNAATIDFSGFAGVLDRISAAIEAYKTLKAPASPGTITAGP